jgi:ribosomal protein S18 acetylase RimI-like enzyme
MSLKIASAEERHADWLVAHDHDVPERWVRRCVSLGEYLIAELDDEPVGFLRFSWFWGAIPYMDMIQVLPGYRHLGIGSALFKQWEKAMRENGATLLMTSSVSNESEPQAWHRKNGFREAGSISFGHLQPVAEVFLVKALR